MKMVFPHMVTGLDTNVAECRVTSLILPTMLPLVQAPNQMFDSLNFDNSL